MVGVVSFSPDADAGPRDLIQSAIRYRRMFGGAMRQIGMLAAAVAVPLASWLRGNPLPLNLVATALGLFVITRHRENARRLLNGTESKFVKKTAPPA